MIPQLDNILLSSAMMWLDNKIMNKAQAFSNVQTKFYPTNNLYNNLITYALPFKQIVADSSIEGADLLSGLYINGQFTNIGQNNLSGINPTQGQAYFTSPVQGEISGRYAIKDFNIYLTNKPDEELLFEGKYDIRPKTIQTMTGIAPNAITYPAIFIKNNGTRNIDFTLDGFSDTEIDLRLMILADSSFNLDAVCAILRDLNSHYIPLIEKHESPFNSYGCVNNGYFNYEGLIDGKSLDNKAFFIKDINISKIVNFDNKLNPSVFPAVADIIVSKIRKA
jgi:hypothetical protein